MLDARNGIAAPEVPITRTTPHVPIWTRVASILEQTADLAQEYVRRDTIGALSQALHADAAGASMIATFVPLTRAEAVGDVRELIWAARTIAVLHQATTKTLGRIDGIMRARGGPDFTLAQPTDDTIAHWSPRHYAHWLTHIPDRMSPGARDVHPRAVYALREVMAAFLPAALAYEQDAPRATTTLAEAAIAPLVPIGGLLLTALGKSPVALPRTRRVVERSITQILTTPTATRATAEPPPSSSFWWWFMGAAVTAARAREGRSG